VHHLGAADVHAGRPEHVGLDGHVRDELRLHAVGGLHLHEREALVEPLQHVDRDERAVGDEARLEDGRRAGRQGFLGLGALLGHLPGLGVHQHGAWELGLRQLADAVATIEDRQSGLDGAIPFGLLVTELVFNALEHGFGDRQSGQVRVGLAWRGDTPWLSVSDDGVGLRPGFDLRSTTSMGLQLATSLAQQLGGELEAHNEVGAVFTAALPRL